MDEKLFGEFQNTVKAFQTAVDRHDEEIKKTGEASAETKNLVDTLNTRISELDQSIKSLTTDVSVSKERNDAIEAAMKRVGPEKNESSDPREGTSYKSFMEFMRQGKNGMTGDGRKFLVEDATGQILVPDIIDAELYRTLPKVCVMRDLVTVRNVTGNRIRRRSITEVTVGWGQLELGGANVMPVAAVQTPAFSDYQYVEDLYALAKVGEDELADNDINLEAVLTESFTNAVAAAEDLAIMNGLGHAAGANGQPEGLLLAASGLTRVDSGQALAVKADDFLNLIYAVDARYRKNGKFIMASTTELAIRKLKDGMGQYLWQPSVQLGTPNTFLSYAVINDEDVPAIAHADVALFGDFKACYRLLDRSGMTIQRLTELYSEAGLVGFKIHRRVGGGVIRPLAVKVLHVTA